MERFDLQHILIVDETGNTALYCCRVWEESPSVSTTGFIPSP